MKAVKTLVKVLFGLFGFLILIGLWVGDKNASPSIPTAAATAPNSTHDATPAPVTQATTPERPTPEQPKRTTARTTQRDSSEHAMTVTKWGMNTMPIMNAITRDLQATTEAAGNMEVAEMVQGCRTLKRSVGRLRNELPAPDSELDAALSAAVHSFTESANHCIRGGSSLDVSELQEAANHMTAGGRHMVRATERVKELGRYIER